MSLSQKTRDLIAQYEPSMTVREKAYLCRDIWQSVSKRRRKLWGKGKGGYWSIPQIPELISSVAAVYGVLISAEEANLDVGLGWSALGAGASASNVKNALADARKRANSSFGIPFPQHFSERLVELKCSPPPIPTPPSPSSDDAGGNDNAHVDVKSKSPTEDAPAPNPAAQSHRRPGRPSKKHQRPTAHAESLTVEASDLRIVHEVALWRKVDHRVSLHQLIEAGFRIALDEYEQHGARLKDLLKPQAPTKQPAVPRAHSKASQPKPSEEEKMPPLHERLEIVMGQDDVGIDEAIKRLKKRGKNWAPKSTDLKAYISLALSTHTGEGGLFDRVSRGIYRVKRSYHKTTASALVKKANGAQKLNGLEDLGNDVMNSPFSFTGHAS
jgi:hypothetical protein